MKRKILITVIAVIVVLSAVIGYLHINKLNTANADSPSEMMERVEQALGDEYKKQTETVVAGTIKYADKEGNPLYPVPILWNAKELEQIYYDVMER